MSAELLPNFRYTWNEIWRRLASYSSAPDDLFVELVGSLEIVPVAPLQPPPPSLEAFDADGVLIDAEALEAINEYQAALSAFTQARDAYESALSSNDLARSYFRGMLEKPAREAEAVKFLEDAHAAIDELGNARVLQRYSTLVSEFLMKFNLRYELRDKFTLHATMPGLFIKVLAEIKRVSRTDDHLSELFDDFEEAFSDLRSSRSPARLKTCLQKQFNLLEGLGSKCPGVTEATLGGICNQVSWPHATIREVGKKLYGFASDYPGVRHAGNPQSALRNLNMNDFVSLSLVLASFTPYLTAGLDGDHCYTA